VNLPLAPKVGYCFCRLPARLASGRLQKELASGQKAGKANQTRYQHVVSLAYPWATEAATKAESEPNACTLAFIASFCSAICFDFSSLITFLYVAVGFYCFCY